MKENTLLFHDRPIEGIKGDLLNRAGFSQAIARIIKNWDGKDSYVLGLYGAWGSGKSSIKNMIMDVLKDDQEVEILNFEPWQLLNQEKLATVFFDEIRTIIGKPNVSENVEKSKKIWKLFSAKVGLYTFSLETVSKYANKIVGFIGVVLSLCGIAAFKFPFVNWLITILGIISVIIALGGWGSEYAKKKIEYYEALEDASKQTLQEIKKELKEYFSKKIKKKILIFIDDIDRLNPSEIKLIMQLVRSNADLPQLIYVLLFQKEVVAKHLSENEIDGNAYLEKIIQAGYNVPEVQSSELEKILTTNLDILFKPYISDGDFDKQHWETVFYLSGLRGYFQNLRDVYRFLNTLSVQANLFKNENILEANSTDLIALEALRMFEPSVYDKLPALTNVLTGTGPFEKKDFHTALAFLLEEVPEIRMKNSKGLLIELFPILNEVYHPSKETSDRWLRQLRICHKKVFDRYFTLSVPEHEFNKREMEYFLSITGDKDKLVSEFQNLAKKDKLMTFLEALEAHIKYINLEAAIPFITAIYDIGDEYLSDETTGFFSSTSAMQAKRVITWFLKRVPDSEITRIYTECIKNSVGLCMPVSSIYGEEERDKRNVPLEYFRIPEADMPFLRGLCLEKIKQSAVNGTLILNRNLNLILWTWRLWGGVEEPRDWVDAIIRSNDGLLSFLVGIMSTSVSISGTTTKLNHYIRNETIERYTTIETLEACLANLSSTINLTEKQNFALKALQRAKYRKENNIPDDVFHDDEDNNEFDP